MTTLRALFVRLAGLVGGARRDRELDEEIASHIALHVDDNIRAGMSPAEARRAALVRFGGVEAVKEAYRDRRGIPLLESLTRDAGYGLRLLRRSPGFATAAILSLALGIGANTAIFSILNALILRPLPVRDPERLVQLRSSGSRGSWTHPLWTAVQTQSSLFDGVTAWSAREFDLANGGAVDPAAGLVVSARFFDVLGVSPLIGRTFGADDDRRGGGPDGPVAVIGYGFWQGRFGGAADVLGRTISIERVAFTIVGVTPPGFFGPNVGRTFDVAIPIGAYPLVLGRDRLDEPSWWWLSVMARLPEGQTAESLTRALADVKPRMVAALPANQRPRDTAGLEDAVTAVPAAAGPSALRAAYRQPLLTLMIVVGLILLMACVNIANVLLARAERRRHEVAVRLALGASRGRLVRQFVVESFVLASLGAGAGLILAQWAGGLLVGQLSTIGSPPTLDLSLEWRLLAFAAGLAVAVAFLFGTVPAFRATGIHPAGAMKDAGRNLAGRSQRASGALIVTQVALCVVLIFAAGLFVRTFAALAMRDTGFESERLLVVTVDARRSSQPLTSRMRLFGQIVDAARALPGVEGAALSALTPVSSDEWETTLDLPRGADTEVRVNQVSPGWFRAYGIPVVRGRDFSNDDLVERSTSVIVNESLARRFFPDRNPIGLAIREAAAPDAPAPTLTIVGVVKDSVYLTVRDTPSPVLYMPVTPGPVVSLTVRAADRSPAHLIPEVTAALGRVDRDLSLRIRPLDDDLGKSVARERLLAMLSGFCGALALLLASVGLYGVVSYVVGSRRSEIGVRMALGATAAGIVALVVRRAAVLVGVGLAIGIAASLWTSRFIGSFLYDVEPRDPSTLVAATLILAGVGAAASWLPARRAARIDPARVLREG